MTSGSDRMKTTFPAPPASEFNRVKAADGLAAAHAIDS
jgi:hypothetical protein